MEYDHLDLLLREILWITFETDREFEELFRLRKRDRQAAHAEVAMLVFLRFPCPSFDIRYKSVNSLTLRTDIFSASYMAVHLPVELVGEIWRAAAELFIETDHRTVLDIAASCTIGYYAATPVLYRTLFMNDHGHELVTRVFSTETIPNAPTLGAPPTQRLCPLVKRICAFRADKGFDADSLKHFTKLEMICDSHESFLLAPLSPTVTYLSVWSATWPKRLPATLTHVSVYCYLNRGTVHRNEMRAYALPDSVTHFALMFCYAIPQDAEEELVVLIQSKLARKGINNFTIWLLGDAANESNYRRVLRAVAALQLSDRNRVRLWRDTRSGFAPSSGKLGAKIKMDVVAGRTLWTEARPIAQEELTAATIVDA